jgi:hypothetical protein
VVKMATVLEQCTTEEQRVLCVFFVGKRTHSVQRILKKEFPVCGGKCSSCKVVQNWVHKFSQGRSKSQMMPDQVATEATVQWVEELFCLTEG